MSASPESGTSIDSLESGNVPNAADASRMAEILRDMNASGADVAGDASVGTPVVAAPPVMAPPAVPMPPPQMMPMAPIGSMNGQIPMMVQQQQQPQFVPYEEDVVVAGPPKKNVWSNIFDKVMDPIFVVFLVFTLSLPVIQTFLSKHATWAFSVGGQLSWLGLAAKSVLAGILFALYKLAGSALGL